MKIATECIERHRIAVPLQDQQKLIATMQRVSCICQKIVVHGMGEPGGYDQEVFRHQRMRWATMLWNAIDHMTFYPEYMWAVMEHEMTWAFDDDGRCIFTY